MDLILNDPQEYNENNDFSKYKDLFNVHHDYSDDLWNAINVLREININTSENCKQLHNQLNDSSDINLISNQIDPLYVQMKEDFSKLQNAYDCLLINFKDNKLNSEQIINELNERINNDNKKYEDDINNKCLYYENIIDKLNTNHEIRVAEIYNRLYSIEASADFRFDEMQSQMQILIDDTNKKLRESTNSNHILRSELMALKNQQKMHLVAADKKNVEIIKDLEDKLLFTEEQLRQTQEKLFEQINKSFHSNPTHDNPSLDSTNESLAVPGTDTKTNLDDFVDSNAFLGINKSTYKNAWSRRKTGTVYKNNKNLAGAKKVINTNKSNLATSSTSKVTNNDSISSNDATTRKRKLYNPDDLDYLNNLKHYE